MMEFASRLIGRFSDAVRLYILAIIGVMMTGVGVVLAIGARPEAIFPLVLGAMAISGLRKSFADFFRR